MSCWTPCERVWHTEAEGGTAPAEISVGAVTTARDGDRNSDDPRFAQIIGTAWPWRGRSSRSSAWRRPIRRCCSWARRAPARSWSRGRSTSSARAAGAPSSSSTARPSRSTCSRASCSATRRAPSRGRSRRRRPLRAGGRRHALPRRGRRHPGAAPGQAAARAPGAGVRAARQHAHAAGGRAHRRGHQPRPRGDGRARGVPRGPLLPPERLPDPAAAAARSARGHSRAGHYFVETVSRKIGKRIGTIPPATMAAFRRTTGPGTSASCRT